MISVLAHDALRKATTSDGARDMEFNHFLSTYYPDTRYGAVRLYADMIEQARLAERLAYQSVALPEHHLINILLTPAPLSMAVKVEAETKRVRIVTSVAVLPLHDMRIYAGELVVADALTDGRLILGVGRGAFGYEMDRMGVPLADSRAKFDESLDVLNALLTREEVAWDGRWYKFDPITVMPRPARPIPMMIAALAPEAIYHSVKRGCHIQTTPLMGTREHMLEQVDAFRRGRDELGAAGRHLELSLLRVAYVARDEADKREKVAMAYDYYKRFDNVFTGPGLVRHGAIEPLPRKQTIEELERNLLIGTAAEVEDKLAEYAEVGIDETILNMNIGCGQAEKLAYMERFAATVMPRFAAGLRVAAAR